ncbi:Putative phagocytic receptor 1a [Glycine soja]|uniref:Transmembrane 9 superfamily member n=1 Tax=Glycine soja TaxID=3848 RepID=A0A0B2PMQ9_GLYSO|nr:Putative phagocytic receptor 1a [Glycine soja]
MVAMMMLRTLYRDISKYNQLETQEEVREESGQTCPWRCFQASFKLGFTLGVDDCHALALGPYGTVWWLLFGASLQDVQGNRMEKNCSQEILYVSCHCLCNFVLNALIWVTEDPVKTNKIARQIPEQPWYMNSVFILLAGILPFGAVFIELFFILTSIWLHQFYYIFVFLFIVFLILIVTRAEITIVLCYFQLCSEDYRWWWGSYLTSGSSALYLLLYAAFYFTRFEITKPVSGVLFFGYMLLLSYGFFVVPGKLLVGTGNCGDPSARPLVLACSSKFRNC